MKSPFRIRSATLEDAEEVHQVLRTAFKDYEFYYSEEAFTDTILPGKKAIDRINQMNVYVAVDQVEEIIGTIGWELRSKTEGHIRGMAVHPNWHGKGVALKLLETAESDAIKHGCTIMTLDTTEILQQAQKFYIKQGYSKTGKTGDFFGAKVYEFAKYLN